MDELKRKLSRRDYRIVKLRTLYRMTQADIARRVGLTQQGVSFVIAKCRRIARAIEAQFRELSAA